MDRKPRCVCAPEFFCADFSDGKINLVQIYKNNQIWHFILQKSNFLNLNVIFRNAKIDIPLVSKYVIIRISITNLLYYF